MGRKPIQKTQEDYERIAQKSRERALAYYHANKERISQQKKVKYATTKAAREEEKLKELANTTYNLIMLSGGQAAIDALRDLTKLGELCDTVPGLTPAAMMDKIINTCQAV